MSDDNDDLIRHLARLTPTPAGDATAIAFEAGRRSAHGAVVRWRVATTMAIVAAVATLPLRTPPDRPTLAATAPPQPIETSSPIAIAPLPPDNVIALRDAVLANGLDGLPPLPRTTARPTGVHDLIGGDL